jgi:flavin-dependent dehydrogenase
MAAAGARVLLLDPSHPREKPCGGGVTDRALAIVRDVLPIAPLPAVRIRTARFLRESGPAVDVPLHEAHGLIVASRATFDGALLSAAVAAGATHRSSRVTHLTAEPGGVRIAIQDGAVYTVPFVVGADGANGLCRRRLVAPFSRRQLSIATGFFAAGATSDSIALAFVDDPPGYLWSFPRPDHLAIGICAQADGPVTSAALRDRAARWIAAHGLAPADSLRPYAWPIPSLSSADLTRLPVAGPRWMLVGDAAGLVDPITREGIYFALRSAGDAASALASGSATPEVEYAGRVRAHLVPELARAADLKAAFFRPRFTRLLVDALEESAPIRQVMADLVAGVQGYRGLRRRLVATFEIGLAARLTLGALGH